MEKRKRHLWAQGLKTSENTFDRMGKGITSLELSYNASETSEKYIDEEVKTTTIDEYAPSFDGEQTCYKDEPIFEYLNKKRLQLATGSDAESEVINVDIMDKQTDGSYTAQVFACSISITSYDGTVLKYKVNLNSAPKNGNTTIANKKITFTEKDSE